MKLTSEIGCLICDQKLWVNLLDQENLQWTKLSMEEDLDLALEPVERFQEIMQNFSIECEQCLNIPLVCLMGRTGSGKSTLMNVLADCKPSYTKSSVGTKEICFEDGVCEVGSGGNTILTKPLL
jgi:ABC-type polysaccharide/polyol phosphate transport system ATPase subunit